MALIMGQGPTRRRFLESLATLGGMALLRPGPFNRAPTGQESCTLLAGKTIRWIVPFSPGGGYDTYSRLIEPFLEDALGAEIVVDNVPGAGGLVAAKTLMDSEPDGLTIGLMNGPGLLVAALTGQTQAPDPADDLSILGRVVRSARVWTTGANSPFRSIDDVMSGGLQRPIVFGVSEIMSAGFVDIAVVAALLGIRSDFIAGFPGARQTALAAMRGDVDLADFHYESVLDRIEAGDLRVLLRTTSGSKLTSPILDRVPVLGGDEGLAVRRAEQLGSDTDSARVVAEALDGVNSVGRLVMAPRGLEASVFQCLQLQLFQTLTDPRFEAAAAAASRSLDVAPARAARADAEASRTWVRTLLPFVTEAITKVRG
jgi:tripartite-type tricarboxylate transporter receptor subunit TctC